MTLHLNLFFLSLCSPCSAGESGGSRDGDAYSSSREPQNCSLQHSQAGGGGGAANTKRSKEGPQANGSAGGVRAGGRTAKTHPEFGCVKQYISGETTCGERSNEVDQSRDNSTREEGPERNPEK